jgi:hypothetical protein
MTRLSIKKKVDLVFVFLIIIIFVPISVLAYADNSLIVVVKNAQTGEELNGASVYIDGAFTGTTTAQKGPGTLQVINISPGFHTMRINKAEYREGIRQFLFPDEKKVEVMLNKGYLVPLKTSGPSADKIDVIFIPSSTTFNCSNTTKISISTYTADESRFQEDVWRVVNQTYLHLDLMTSPMVPLPKDYQDQFNIYYYYNPTVSADAFSGCAGTVADRYWDDVPFGDISVILYPTYYGVYSGKPCPPAACYQSQSKGRDLMKAPADNKFLFAHETGHAVFGLVDTYCGDTYYYENNPHPNVWSSAGSCIADAHANNRDSVSCRQIDQKSPGSCSKNYWCWDPDPDIMRTGYSGTFGAAATQHIRNILLKTRGG